MSLVGGALSVTGGVLNAGATVAGIAARAAGGVIGAAGGLMGGGQSGMVKSKSGKEYDVNSPQGKTIVTANKARKARESKSKSSKGGMSLAKVKPVMKPMSSKLGSVKSGSMPEVATGHESESTILSQILTQMGTNTGILTAMLNVLATPPPEPVQPAPVIISPPEDLIDNSKKVKGDNDGEGGGRVKRVFGAVSEKLKSLSSSLGGTAKFLMKGLLGGAALIGFIKYKDNIRDFIARAFEGLESFSSKFFDSDDPFSTFFDSLTSTGEGSILDSLKKGLAFVIEELVYALKVLLNQIPGINIPLTDKEQSRALGKLSEEDMSSVNDSTVMVAGTGTFVDTPDNINEGAKEGAGKAVGQRVQKMFDAFQMSGGRVQWTNVGSGFTMEGPWSLTNMNPGITVSDIMSSEPIFDGNLITMETLNSGLDYESGLEGLSKGVREDVISALSQKSNYEQMTQRGITQVGGFFGLNRTNVSEKVQALDLKIKKLRGSDDSASLGNNGNINLVESGAKIGTVNTGDNVAMPSRVDDTDRTQRALQEIVRYA